MNVIWKGKYFSVCNEDVQNDDGGIDVFEYVWRVDGTRTIVVDNAGRILITKEIRHEQGEFDWRLPGGKLDDAEEPILEAAARELREETGVTAQRWQYLWPTTPDATVRFRRHFLFATDISIGEQKLEKGENISVHWFSPFEVQRMALTGVIREEISALSLLRFLDQGR